MISAAFPYQKKRQRVLGREMAYIEVGSGDPIDSKRYLTL
jgi:haloalkane dehalogenase